MESLILIGILGGVLWFWYDTVKTHQIARRICKRACRNLNVQLLDDTIALTKLRLSRAENGQLNLQRTYEFEFSADFETRQRGMIQLQGHQLSIIEFPGHMNRTILSV